MGKVLEGRVAIVTGAGQGVGQGIARAYAAEGANLLIAQRRLEEVEREAQYLRDTYGVTVHAMKCDVTVREEVRAIVATTVEKFGRLDILVNNAGASLARRLENYTDENMEYALKLNYWSAFWAMQAAFPIMKAQKYGRIINLGSLNGVNAHMFTVGYNVGKEAVRTLARTAAVEWGCHGITANTICPSAMSPQAIDYFRANPEMERAILAQVPVGRFGDSTNDIGPVAVFLASEASAYTTGNTLFVDGGGHINGVPWRPEVED